MISMKNRRRWGLACECACRGRWPRAWTTDTFLGPSWLRVKERKLIKTIFPESYSLQPSSGRLGSSCWPQLPSCPGCLGAAHPGAILTLSPSCSQCPAKLAQSSLASLYAPPKPATFLEGQSVLWSPSPGAHHSGKRKHCGEDERNQGWWKLLECWKVVCKCRHAVTDTNQCCLTKLLLSGPWTPRIGQGWAQCPEHHEQSQPDFPPAGPWASLLSLQEARPTSTYLCSCSEVEVTHPVSTLQPNAWYTWGWQWEFRALLIMCWCQCWRAVFTPGVQPWEGGLRSSTFQTLPFSAQHSKWAENWSRSGFGGACLLHYFLVSASLIGSFSLPQHIRKIYFAEGMGEGKWEGLQPVKKMGAGRRQCRCVLGETCEYGRQS